MNKKILLVNKLTISTVYHSSGDNSPPCDHWSHHGDRHEGLGGWLLKSSHFHNCSSFAQIILYQRVLHTSHECFFPLTIDY